MGGLHPIDDELDLHNMRILAKRTKWPAGTLRVCERLARELPGWTVYWGTGRVDEPPRPGYYALRGSQDWGEPPAYGETPEMLRQVVKTWPYPKWKYEPIRGLPVSPR